MFSVRNFVLLVGNSYNHIHVHTPFIPIPPHSSPFNDSYKKEIQGPNTGRVHALHFLQTHDLQLQSSPAGRDGQPSIDALSSMRCQRFCLVRRVSCTMDIHCQPLEPVTHEASTRWKEHETTSYHISMTVCFSIFFFDNYSLNTV